MYRHSVLRSTDSDAFGHVYIIGYIIHRKWESCGESPPLPSVGGQLHLAVPALAELGLWRPGSFRESPGATMRLGNCPVGVCPITRGGSL